MFFESFLLNLAVIIVLIVALIFDYVTKFFSYWYIRHIPYKYPIPFFGSDYHRVLGLRSTTEEVSKLYEKHKEDKLVGCIKSRIPDLIVKDTEIIEFMLLKESANFKCRGLGLERSQDVCLRNNLFYAEGEKWSLWRNNLESILKCMARKFEQNERSLDKYLHEVNGEINVQNFLENIMDGVIKDLVFAEGLNYGEDSIVSDLRRELREVTITTRFKSYLKSVFPSIYILFGLNTLKSQPDNKIHQTLVKSSLIQETKGMSFEYSSASKGKLTMKHENSEMSVAFSILSSFITEGYIPCLNTISCLLYELSKNQEIQRKARNDNKDCLENVIKETMRLYPPYSFITRKCTKSFKFPESDLLIDKGVTITIPIDSIHKDQDYYENPRIFNPDRFSKERTEKKSDCSIPFMPYGIGPRKCIGEELSQLMIRRVTSSILSRYQLEKTDRTPPALHFKDHNFARILDTEVWVMFVPLK